MREHERRLWLLRRARKNLRARTRRKRSLSSKLTKRRHLLPQRYEANKQIRRFYGDQIEEISFPPVFCLKIAPDETLNFLKEVEEIFQKASIGRVCIHHGTIQVLGLEAAILLISEFSRITQFAPHLKLIGEFNGLNDHIKSILIGIGYFRYYPKLRKIAPADYVSNYIRHVTGTGSDPKASGKLVEAFFESGHLTALQAQRLGKCILECLDNVSHHAYTYEAPRRLHGRWWLVGYCDKVQGELFFAVVDHGVGIARSLKNRRREDPDSLKELLIGRSDEELIVEAFTRSFSRTMMTNRGLGLPGLKRILDTAGRGEIFVKSGSSECKLIPGKHPVGSSCQVHLDGTLIAWRLKRNQL
jgi:hypothetical protein